MELKMPCWLRLWLLLPTFNRTAYGIEKLLENPNPVQTWPFNRTAYGIENQLKQILSFRL